MDREQQSRIKEALRAYTAKATSTPEAARETLVREGIYQKDGSLSPRFSAPKRKSA